MKLRPFEISDAAIILSWCKDEQAFRLWSADRYEHFPAQPHEMLLQYEGSNMYPLTAYDDTGIIGHILIRFTDEEKRKARLGFVIVDSSIRGKGYGKELVKQAIDYALHSLGVAHLSLGVFKRNLSALKCYESAGFQIIGEDKYCINGEVWEEFEMELNSSLYAI